MSFEDGRMGELEPRLAIQQDEMACLSACLLSLADPEKDLSERAITDLLSLGGLYEKDTGTGLYAARVLDYVTGQIGLATNPVYDARGLSKDEQPRIDERIVAIQNAIRDEQRVVLAFPKRREDESSFLHYAVVTGFTGAEQQDEVVVMDPSNIDGGIKRHTWEEFAAYVTPEAGIPVMAWGISHTKDRPPKVPTQKTDIGQVCLRLLTEPLYQEADTGKAIPPGTRHPSSVVMPTTEITKQFVEFGEVVLSRNGKHPVGYPRFVVPPIIRELSLAATNRFTSLPFPTKRSAQAAAHLENTYGNSNTADIVEQNDAFWLPDTKLNLDAWQHTGLGISSRQAEAILEGRPENNLEQRAIAEQEIKNRIDHFTGANSEDIYLFPTGMAAIYLLNQALIQVSNDAPAIQFGFPYVDTYEQRKFGPEKNTTKNMSDVRDASYARLQDLISSGQPFRALMTEYPTNPLLQTPDFERLHDIVGADVPIIIDDTIGTIFNLDDQKLPDSVAARVTSLTKFFSSTGDVMGGSIALRPESPHYQTLKEALSQTYEDTLWYEDAEALANNSRQFDSVMPAINHGGAELATWLEEEWGDKSGTLQTIYHPALTDNQVYNKYRKRDGGYGGLMSLRFNDPARAYRFFDALRITKGPSLGTLYSLGCLYTWLAHKPFSAVEKFGVTPDLVRISVGIEPVDELKTRFDDAFGQSKESS